MTLPIVSTDALKVIERLFHRPAQRADQSGD
jgi:hypothetical protein